MFNIFKRLTKRSNRKIHIIEEEKINNNPIKAIIITDLHGTARFMDEQVFSVFKEPYDVCFILGDCTSYDLDILMKYLDISKTYYVCGNHDDVDIYSKYNIRNIHGQQIEIKGKTFVGWEGSHKYKASAIGMTQDESITFEKTLPVADYLVAHDGPYIPEKINDIAHQGLKGITNYQKRTKCFIIRGHLHTRYTTDSERCFYKIETCVL